MRSFERGLVYCGRCQRISHREAKKKQKRYYSGKKKKHTIKAQLIIRRGKRKVLKTNFCEGKKHDFKLFKESRVPLKKETKAQADTGYQGIQDIHQNSETPKKKSKKKPLSREDKRRNREISRQRIEVENVLASLKRFRILSDRYRNRRRRFGLRFNLIAGVHNYEL